MSVGLKRPRRDEIEEIPQVKRCGQITSALEYKVCCFFVRDLHFPGQGVAGLLVEFADGLVSRVVRVDAEADSLINEWSMLSNPSC